VDVVKWVEDLEQFSELKEVWIKMECIPPRWCDWRVFAQMSSGFGLLLEVNWAHPGCLRRDCLNWPRNCI
jgi:hypothetical protein